jgi:hypothetical protein
MLIFSLFGGLGNQMFQYAFAKNIEISKKKKIYFVNDMSESFKVKRDPKILEKSFTIKTNVVSSNKFKGNFFFYNRFFRKVLYNFNFFQSSFVNESNLSRADFSKNLYFHGYWQNYKYFEENFYILRKEFSFIKKKDKNLSFFKNKILNCNSTSIHFRHREDSILKKIDISFYSKAIKLIRTKEKNTIFFIFSDDIDLAKIFFNSNFKNNNFIFVEKITNPHNDMHLMSLCKNNIIVESTFSLWASLLNNNSNKLIIYPNNYLKKFFNHKIPFNNLGL